MTDTAKKSTVLLRLVAGTHVLVDPITGLEWKIGETIHEVEADVAERLEGHREYILERVSDEEHKAIKKAEAAEAKAKAELEKLAQASMAATASPSTELNKEGTK